MSSLKVRLRECVVGRRKRKKKLQFFYHLCIYLYLPRSGQSSQKFSIPMPMLIWKGGQNSLHKCLQGMPLIFSVVMYRINSIEVLWRLLKVGLAAGTLNFYDLYWMHAKNTMLFPERNCHMGLEIQSEIWLLPIASVVT